MRTQKKAPLGAGWALFFIYKENEKSIPVPDKNNRL